MLTLRIIPPRLLPFRAARRPADRDLTALYFEALWRHWGLADRMIALALVGGGSAFNLVSGDRRAWRHGWDGAEQALLEGGHDHAAHLGMAARKGLHRLINAGAYPLDANPLKNKRLFAVRCRAAGLAVPEGFSGTPDEVAAWMSGQDAIIAKPNYGSKGAGIVGFRRSGAGWISAGAPASDDAVASRLRALLRRGGVVQRVCSTHPDLIAVSPGALPTLRVMTAANETGVIEACDRVIRLSAGGPRPVDNFNASNIVAGVDGAGRIELGRRRVGRVIARLDRHPTTGAALVGWPLPDLAAAEALALRAHALFRDGFAVVGWDVGLTSEGPVLIEGNWNPGTDILQLVSGRGLGDSRLGAIYRHHLAAVSAAAWRAARPIQREPRRGASPALAVRA